MPDGLVIETMHDAKCTIGVGKRMAEAVLRHFKVAVYYCRQD